jgi:hypothetical protein
MLRYVEIEYVNPRIWNESPWLARLLLRLFEGSDV